MFLSDGGRERGGKARKERDAHAGKRKPGRKFGHFRQIWKSSFGFIQISFGKNILGELSGNRSLSEGTFGEN